MEEGAALPTYEYITSWENFSGMAHVENFDIWSSCVIIPQTLQSHKSLSK